MKMYRRAIVDELGCVVVWCDELECEEEIITILMEYPECSVKCIEV